MFEGRNKAVTFSFDDGVTQDIRLIELLDRYGLKCTFNLNSELLGLSGTLERNGVTVDFSKVKPEDVRKIYAGHEVAAHTLTHPLLPSLDEAEIIRQVEQDRLNLSELCGYEVLGMAYPCGGVNFDDRVVQVIRERTGIRYARTTRNSHEFATQTDLYRFRPSEYHLEMENTMRSAERFLALLADTPALFYVWGHSFEFDAWNSWAWFEELCAMLSGHKDVFYGTNRQVLLSASPRS